MSRLGRSSPQQPRRILLPNLQHINFGTDSGSGVSTENVVATIVIADTAIGVDTESVTVLGTAVSDNDTGSSVDAAFVSVQGTEATTGVDTAIISVQGTDAGTGVETQSVAASFAVTDIWASVEFSSVTAMSVIADTAVGTDTESVSVLGTFVTDTDSGTGVDTAIISVQGTDAGTGVETQSITISSIVVDTATSSESSSTANVSIATDAAIGIDTESIIAAPINADFGTSVESFSLIVAFTDVDASSSIDSQSIVVAVFDSDTGSGVDTGSAQILGVLVSDADTGIVTEFASSITALSATDVVIGTDLGSVGALSLAGLDTGIDVESASIVATVLSDDISVSDETASVTTTAEVTQVSADTITVVDDSTIFVSTMSLDSSLEEETTAILSVLLNDDTSAFVDNQLFSASLSDQDVFSATDSEEISFQDVDTVSSIESTTVFVSVVDEDTVSGLDVAIAAIPDTDSAQFSDFAVASLAPLPLSIFELESPSVVEVLRYTTTRVNGSLSIQWVPIAQLLHGQLETLSLRRPFDTLLAPGQIAVRLDLQYVRPGVAQPPPPQAGFMPDRSGVMFADVSAAGLLKAGDRVRCVSGPIDGTFEIRVIPDLPSDYSTTHHLEVEVVEVSQKSTSGSYFAPDIDPSQFVSYMRDLYDTRVAILRRSVVSEMGGSAREAWNQIDDVLDVVLGVPGEMMCRLSLRLLRRGKDQLPPLVAGRAPDRVGVLYCDVTPHLRAGDRLHCLEGPITGTFELRVAPDLSPDLTSIHHLEVQVIEVSQALVGVYPRAEVQT